MIAGLGTALSLARNLFLAFDRAGNMGAHRRAEPRLARRGEVIETGQHLADDALGVPIFRRLADEGPMLGIASIVNLII